MLVSPRRAAEVLRSAVSGTPKWCCTSPGETPAAVATSRIDVASTPLDANPCRAAFRIRADALRSDGRTASCSSDGLMPYG